jgi:transposase
MANMIRSLLREFGHILPIGIEAVTAFAKRHLKGDHPDMPEIANGMLGIQCYQFIGLNERIEGYSKMIEQHALLNADARRLMRMPGIGPITASAIVATIGDAHQFRTGRDLAAWLGLTPLNKSSGGKENAGQDHQARRSVHSKAAGRQHDIARSHGETFAGEGRSLDGEDHRGQAVPAGNQSPWPTRQPDHLGHAHEETGIPAARVLTAQTVHEMQDVEVMMRK